MKQFSGFEAKKTGSSREILPAGAYVCEIKSVKEESFDWGNKLAMMIEIIEGEYKDFWRRDYDNNNNDDRKWRGVFRIDIPKDDGTEQDSWTKRKFGNFIWAVQESNPGYVWAWDEKTLKGKKIGVVYRNKEWAMGDLTGWTTEAGGAASIEDVRNGKVKPLKDKPLKNRPAPAVEVVADTVDDESDLPF